MNRTESAIKILDAQGAYCGQCSREPGDSLNACRDCAAVLETYANALEEAGLLAPDLPEVSKGTPVHWTPEWEKHMEQGAEEAHLDGTNVSLDRSNQKIITLAKGSHIDHYGVGEAKAVALALLAACEYAEKEQDNEQPRES